MTQRDTAEWSRRTLSPGHAESLRRIGHQRRYAKDAVLFAQGAVADSVALLESGAVKVFAMSGSGAPHVLALRRAGELVGEFAVLDKAARSATAMASEISVVTVVSAERFRTLVAADPDFAVDLLGTVVRRVRDSDRRQVRLAVQGALERVATVLLDLAHQGGRTHPEGMEVTVLRSELAATAGISQESTWRALRRLERDDLVVRHKGRIVVKDAQRLAALLAS